MRTLKSLRTTTLILASAVGWTIALTLLPHDDYQRWQLLKGTEFDTLRTIYERVHYDARPLDVVIVGPSKAALGLSVKRIRADLAAMGAPATAANFSVMASGRDKDYAILRELYKTKRPKVIVVGVDAVPYPYGHQVFKYFASSADILAPPQFGLKDQFANALYLPFRQLRLFVSDLLPHDSGLSKRFDPQSYRRREAEDYTEGFVFHGEWIDTAKRATAEELAKTPWTPPAKSRVTRVLNHFNDGYEYTYLREIARMAKAHGTKLIFVYLPEYGAPAHTAEAGFLRQYGELVDAGDLAKRPELYREMHHLNRYGAAIVSDRVAKAVARTLAQTQTQPPAERVTGAATTKP